MVGLGCHLDAGVALDKAVLEVARCARGPCRVFGGTAARTPHTIRTSGRSRITRLLRRDSSTCRSSRFSSRRLAYAGRDFRAPSTSAEAQAETCVERACGRGHRRLRRPHEPDLEPFGIRIVRALATGLQPIHFGPARRGSAGGGSTRCRSSLGYTTRTVDEDDLNPCPHPLA